MRKKFKWIMAVTILSVLSITGCDLITQTPDPTPMPTPVVDVGVIAEANLVPAEDITLGFAIPGKVATILVEEGDFVEEGQALARLQNVESLEAQILAAELAVLDAEQRMDDLNERAELVAALALGNLVEARQALVDAERAWDVVDTDEFIEELDDARLEMIEAEQNLEEAQDDLADHQDLDTDNPTRRRYEDELEEAQQNYNEARWDFEELENRYESAKAQLETARKSVADAERIVEKTRGGRPDPDNLALANASLDSAKGQLRAAERALGDVELTAPFAGKVIRIELIEGAYTSPGQMAFVLADMSAWYLETNDLTEQEVVQIDVGEDVVITFDALPDLSFTGEVESISEYFLDRFGDITFVVRVRLQDSDVRLRWGMTAEVRFPD